MNIPPTRFSVVIPAYNAEGFIEHALDSIRNQILQPKEVLVTNDGSNDDTALVVSKYSQKYPEIPIALRSQENKGIGAARNNGLFCSTGDFVAFLDADDIWYPNKLACVDTVLKRDLDIGVVYHNEVVVDSSGKRNAIKYGAIQGNSYRHLLYHGNRVSTSAAVVSRPLALQLGGFSEDMRFNGAEDYDFWLRLAKDGARFHYLDQVHGEYRRRPGGVTERFEYHANNAHNVVRHHLEAMRQEGIINDFRYRCLLRWCHGRREGKIGRAFYLSGNPKKAFSFYLRSIKYWPLSWKNYAGLMLCIRELFLQM